MGGGGVHRRILRKARGHDRGFATPTRPMPDITLIAADGTEHGFEAPDGVSLMAAATGFGVPGILADCGGSASCGTCHVIVDPAWAGRLPPPDNVERLVLETTAVPATATSRLSCQVRLTPDLQGLVVRLPERQV
jgi:2Fe-2S ferredoxin